MRLKIFKNKKYFICKLLCDEIKKEDFKFLKSLIIKNIEKKFAFDLSQVQKIHHSFFKILNEFKISLFALNSSLLTYFSLCGNLNLVPVYLDEKDFLSEKRSLAKRDFKLIK